MPTTGNATASKPAHPVGTIPTETRPRHGGVFFGPRMRYPRRAAMSRRHFGNVFMQIEYVVVADNHCWGAGDSLREALSNAYLRENTRLSFFEWITDASELREQWASWCDWGRDEWRYAGEDEKPVRCMIYPLDRDQWAAWRVCDITGGLSATPSDESVTGREASARLRDLVIHAQWHNGELRPVSDPEASES